MVKRLKEDKTQHVFGSVVNLTKRGWFLKTVLEWDMENPT